MNSPLSLALLGFPPNELAAFNALFRIAARHGPGVAMVEHGAEADVVLANADDAALLQRLRAERPAQVLLIGSSDDGTGWPVLARPIQLLEVLNTVQRLGRANQPGTNAGAATRRAPQVAAPIAASDAVTAYSDLGAIPAPQLRDAALASDADVAAAFDATVPFEITQAPADEPAAPAFAATVPFSRTLPPAAPQRVRAASAEPAFAATEPFSASLPPRPVAAVPSASPALRHDPVSAVFAATVPFSPTEPAFAATEPYVPDAAVLTARALPIERGTTDVIDRASIALWREARRVHVPSSADATAIGATAAGPRPAPATPRAADRIQERIEPRLDPIADVPAALPGPRPWAGPDRGAATSSPQALDNLLVVDAGDRSRRSLLNLLQQQGWRVDLVRSHDEARRQLARRHYRLVVVGESVQGASVFKACRALRRHPGMNGRNLQIVLVLDRSRGWLARWRARWAGYDLCVFGAFDPAALGGMLGSAVRAGAAA
ncbi:MAG: hypothetical protein OJF60_000258 [Burkholderiaceae bacterium]|jgi:CheY-like chemotaxis protein|nr:MAG: hypothetical protein OJF60_000258 [Burkholderiaceae bacterium]